MRSMGAMIAELPSSYGKSMAKLALSTAQELIVFKNASIPQGVDAVNAPSKSALINDEEA